MKIKLLDNVSIDELLLLPIDELKRQFSIVRDIQDIIEKEHKLWTKRLNSYSIYESSSELDNDTATLIITAGARIKYLEDTMLDVMDVVNQYARALDIKSGKNRLSSDKVVLRKEIKQVNINVK